MLIMTLVHDFSGEGYSDVYKLSPDKSNVTAVINNNIDNYQKFLPDSHVVMHVNAEYKDFEWQDRPGVSVSPKRFVVKHGQCQLASILTMFKHACDTGLEFDYVVINHSGELYVRHGVGDYIRQFEFGIWHGPDSEIKNKTLADWPAGKMVIQAAKEGVRWFEDLFDPYDVRNYCVSQLEGSFYSRKLFQKIYDWMDSNYNIDLLNNIPVYLEEIVIPTLAYHLSDTKNFGHPICAFYIENGHRTLDNWQYVQNVIDKKPVITWGADNLPFWAHRLQNAQPVDNLYTVKRINRIMDDPIRAKITNL